MGNYKGRTAGTTTCDYDGDASVCGAGYYRNNWQCKSCPNGQTSRAGSQSSSDCYLPKKNDGSSCSSSSQCQSNVCKSKCCNIKSSSSSTTSCDFDGNSISCSAGYYLSSSRCISCPSGQTSNAGSTSCQYIKLQDGDICSTHTKCESNSCK